MAAQKLLVTKSGFIDFGSRNPLLEEDDGTRCRLEGEMAFDIPLGSDVVVTGVQTRSATINVHVFEVIDE